MNSGTLRKAALICHTGNRRCAWAATEENDRCQQCWRGSAAGTALKQRPLHGHAPRIVIGDFIDVRVHWFGEQLVVPAGC